MLLKADRIITGDGRTFLKHSGVLIREDRIQEVGEQCILQQKYPHEQVVDYGDATIIPGMMDMHSHVGLYYGCSDAYQYNAYRTATLAQFQLTQSFKYGCTTLRDCGCPDGLLEAMRSSARKGLFDAPRIFHANQAIAMTGGHCWNLNIVTEADGIDGVMKCVRRQIKAGADWIKIMTGHRHEVLEFSQEELNTMIHEAHRLGKKVEVHAANMHGSHVIEMAIEAGCDSIEHGNYLTVELATRMREKNIYWTPTMSYYTYWGPLISQKHLMYNFYTQGMQDGYEFSKVFDDLHKENFYHIVKESGVKVITGTDCDMGYELNGSVGIEVAQFIKCGMNPLQAIQAATYNCAEALGIQDEVGLIKPGYIADLTVLNGDPTKDFSCLTDMLETFFSGKSVYRASQR